MGRAPAGNRPASALEGQHVIVVVPYLPWPLTDGGRICLALRIRELHRRGVRVTLFCTARPGLTLPEDSEIRQWCESVTVMARPGAVLATLRHPLLPYSVASRRIPGLGEAIWRSATELKPIMVLMEYTYTAEYRRYVPAGIPVAIGINNIESTLMVEKVRSLGRSLRAIPFALEAPRMRRFENRLLNSPEFDAFIFISDTERDQVVARHPELGSRAYVLPPGTDVSPFEPRPPTKETVFCFLGSLSFAPNVDGISWFVTDVWPGVLAALPEARLLVGGRGTPRELAELLRSQPSVDFVGEVAHVREVYDAATVAVLPIRRGAGVKLKTIEALGTSLPCVGTTLSFEGLPRPKDQVALVADEPAAFASACIEAADPIKGRALAEAAHRYVSENLTWEAIGKRYVDTIVNITSRGPHVTDDERKIPGHMPKAG
jgi:polysaccharide biosynthesis protein PslH